MVHIEQTFDEAFDESEKTPLKINEVEIQAIEISFDQIVVDFI